MGGVSYDRKGLYAISIFVVMLRLCILVLTLHQCLCMKLQDVATKSVTNGKVYICYCKQTNTLDVFVAFNCHHNDI